jgi:putative hemolysin
MQRFSVIILLSLSLFTADKGYAAPKVTASQQGLEGEALCLQMMQAKQALDRVTFQTYVDDAISKFFIRQIERIQLPKAHARLLGVYEEAFRNPEITFSQAALEEFDITVDRSGLNTEAIPSEGPLIVISNHATMFDAFVILAELRQKRDDVMVFIHRAMGDADLPDGELVGVDIWSSDTETTDKLNRRGMAKVLRHLKQGGSLLLFPSGALAITQTFFGLTAEEWPWRNTIGKLALSDLNAKILPYFLPWQYNQSFHQISQISGTLRMAFLHQATFNLEGTTIAPIQRPLIDTHSLREMFPDSDPDAATQFLRQTVLGR